MGNRLRAGLVRVGLLPITLGVLTSLVGASAVIRHQQAVIRGEEHLYPDSPAGVEIVIWTRPCPGWISMGGDCEGILINHGRAPLVFERDGGILPHIDVYYASGRHPGCCHANDAEARTLLPGGVSEIEYCPLLPFTQAEQADALRSHEREEKVYGRLHSRVQRTRLRDSRGRGRWLADLKPGVTLEGTDLRRVVCPTADFSGVRLVRCDLRGADLRAASFNGAELRDCDLRGAQMGYLPVEGAYFGGTDLTDAVLHRCDLRGASLMGCSLLRARYDRATRWSADFNPQEEGHGADLRE